MNRFLIGLFTVASLCCGSLAAAASPDAAKGFVDTLAKEVLAVVQDSSLDKNAQTQKIEALFTDKVDINFVAKFVLGTHWREATEQQRSSYIAAYKPFILKNYANRLTRYSGQTYVLKQARSDADATVVTMEIKDSQGQTINVDYRLVPTGSQYKIVDIIVEGVSLLTTQRSEFGSIINQKGVDGLTEALKQKVAAQS